MVSNNHYIELYINKSAMELESQDSLNLRINNVLFNPTKTSTTQAEYSFTFDLPSTPNNDRILDYANNLSKTNKFHTRYPAELYADGHLIFSGSLTIQKYNASNKMYSCNLVSIKTNTIDEVFGDMVMTDLHWDIDFNGASTINTINNNQSTKYYFPFVSYGVFQKKPYESDEVGNSYTSKFELDKWNKFWIESFYPSLNVMETVRKAFEQQGYVVGGSAFSEPNINNIFASCQLASEQTPIYNVGNPLFGEVNLNVQYTTNGSGYEQELQFPYYYVSRTEATSEGFVQHEAYNFSAVNIYDLLGSGTVTLGADTYMYDPDEKVIVIPADGFYKIDMSVTSSLNTTGTITAKQTVDPDGIGNTLEDENLDLPVGLDDNTPLEIHLVRNYDDNLELIKGKNNRRYNDGNPLHTQYGPEYYRRDNIVNWETCYPHEDPYNASRPTRTNELVLKNSSSRLGGRRDGSSSYGASTSDGNNSSGNNDTSASGNFSGRRGGTRGGRIGFGSSEDRRNYSYSMLGYINKDGDIMCYDQAVSNGFICGFSSMLGGTASVMKNGKSWSTSNSDRNCSFYPQVGYDKIERQPGEGNITTSNTRFNTNTYINCPVARISATTSSMTGSLSCIVWLNKNDILEIFAVHRHHETDIGNPVSYSTTSNVNLKITAFSDRTYDELKADHDNRYEAPVEFPTQLNLFNFTNNEMNVKDWINNVVKAFNLVLTQDENNIDIDINKGIKKTISYAVDVDDRVSSDEAVAEYISYPKEMSVRYKIDTEEYGFECSVPQSHINDDDWKDWGDSGYTVIQLSDDTYETSTQNTQTNFSYTWYCPFTYKQTQYDSTSGIVETGLVKEGIMIPVIEKAEYMADGYGYDEAMKHDGYSLTQRFWYRQGMSSEYVILASHTHEMVFLTYPKNTFDDFHLSYKDTEKSIVSEYFNVAPMLSSNFVKIDVHITPEEYLEIKGGALIHYDSDLYYVSEISGFDPSGGNTTQLKLIKKV